MSFFLDDINDCLWNYLKCTNKKIVLYGMGDGAEKVKAVLDKNNVQVDGIMASDEFVRGQIFLGYKVKKLSEIEEELKDFIVLVCFGTQLPDVMAHIVAISEKHELYAPNVPVVGEGVFDLAFARQHRGELKAAYSLLEDEQSKKVFENIIRYKLSGRIDYLFSVQTDPREIYSFLKLGDNETFVDLGAYNGDTAAEFIKETGGRFEKIYAAEPDSRNFRKLCERLCDEKRIEAFNCGAWSEDTTLFFSSDKGRGSRAEQTALGTREVKMMKVDSMLKGKPASFIKMDVEGAEEQAILGAKNTIATFSPKLNIALYHRNEDMYKLPLLINSINSSYDLYIRHFPYIPDWEACLFAAPTF